MGFFIFILLKLIIAKLLIAKDLETQQQLNVQSFFAGNIFSVEYFFIIK